MISYEKNKPHVIIKNFGLKQSLFSALIRTKFIAIVWIFTFFSAHCTLCHNQHIGVTGSIPKLNYTLSAFIKIMVICSCLSRNIFVFFHVFVCQQRVFPFQSFFRSNDSVSKHNFLKSILIS